MSINYKFNEALNNSGLSMYALSKRSGIPYTTINEIHNGKIDINQCAASTVWRLSAALGASPEEIINDINYIDGIKGKYKGISYVWSSDKNSMITFEYRGKSVSLDAGALYNIPSRIEYYNIAAGWMIKEYIEHIKWEEQVRNIVQKRFRK